MGTSVTAPAPVPCYAGVMRRILSFAAVLLVGALDMSAARAADGCTCRAQGRAFMLGDTACIATPAGPRLATCGMAANVTSWTFSGTSCVVANLLVLPTPAGQANQRAMLVRD